MRMWCAWNASIVKNHLFWQFLTHLWLIACICNASAYSHHPHETYQDATACLGFGGCRWIPKKSFWHLPNTHWDRINKCKTWSWSSPVMLNSHAKKGQQSEKMEEFVHLKNGRYFNILMSQIQVCWCGCLHAALWRGVPLLFRSLS